MARATPITLTQFENFNLIKWLHERKWRHNESHQSILAEAQKELGLVKINVSHITNRIAEFKDSLPIPKAPDLTLEQRLDRAENILQLISGVMLDEKSPSEVADVLRAFSAAIAKGT